MSSVESSAAAGQALIEVSRRISRWPSIVEVAEKIIRKQPVEIDGVCGSSCAPTVAGLAIATASLRQTGNGAHESLGGATDRESSGRNFLVITTDSEAAERLHDDLEVFFSASHAIFPWLEERSDRGATIDVTFGERIALLKRMIEGQSPAVLIAPAAALLQPLPNPQTLRDHSRRFGVGDRVDIEEFCRWLTENGFHATSAVELPGEYSLRGGILDLFAVDWQVPLRIEFFDDEIESIREFVIETQRSQGRRSEMELTVLRPSQHDQAFLSGYLPEPTCVIEHEPERIAEQMKQALRMATTEDQLHSRDDLLRSLSPFAQLGISRLAIDGGDEVCRLNMETLPRFSSDLGDLRIEFDRVGKQQQVILTCSTEGDRERISEIFQSTEVASSGRLHLVEGAVHEGFRIPAEDLVVLDCGQLLNRHEIRRPARRRLGKAIDSFLDLREGDLIVHLAHGIGRYRGLKMLTKEGIREEHLEIEFHGGTKIYVPAAKIDLVQKYIGGARAAPSLARIGSRSWLRQKASAEAAVTDLAAEMLEVQASRAARPGVAYSKDTEWQHEFEAAFPYRETDDQLRAIQDIKQDMQTPRSMDRLLCGDVGYGKTEVSMRAAFKAVENGLQVAVLVPTTILVEQHYRTFRERLAGFPFDIVKLSRFCSTAERKENLEGLRSGRVDIVIGTHRLASRDVNFFNLGLLIIDEEQRFGVEIKERLKSLKQTVDVLTMSATPIPRTLHMSLVGVRDISNLETPPEDRIAVETRVTRFDEEVIRHAALRELNRGGQIYFIHNRVNDIHIIRDRLSYILPDVRIGIAHGQMPESQLEPVMKDFIDHRSDILLATTIVENGLDIPNANTIFINEADRYGLSDLHQLRGRVGRYKHRAFAYLLVERHKHVSPNAGKRLRAIEEFSDMGAGFAIAMRDLEIRGAGNLLGTEQSGHIAAIGYELYCELLESAVRALKKMPPRMKLDVDIDLPIQAYLPDDYVVDKRHKIDLYRRLTRIEQFQQIEGLREEMLDRFGPVPEPVEHLLQLSEIKLEAAIWQVVSIHLDGNDIVFKSADSARMGQLAKLNGRRMRLADSLVGHVRLKSIQLPTSQFMDVLRSVLRPDS